MESVKSFGKSYTWCVSVCFCVCVVSARCECVVSVRREGVVRASVRVRVL